jgi:GTPase KRas
MGLGTRRAVTAPLSPLPGSPEKGFKSKGQTEKGATWKKLWQKLVCWQ